MLGTEASIRPETGDQKCEARTTESEGLGVGEGPERVGFRGGQSALFPQVGDLGEAVSSPSLGRSHGRRVPDSFHIF